MSKKKQTFVDPKTGEEIESTIIARVGSIVILVSVVALLYFTTLSVIRFQLWLIWAVILTILVDSVLIIALGFGWRRDDSCKLIHDWLARKQYSRRQRILKRKLLKEEWAGVPSRALSRAQPPGQPEPTDVSLSQAEKSSDEKPRLNVGVEETTGLEVPVKIR